MEAIREIHTVKEGEVRVHLPAQFWGQQVEIIVLPAPRQKQSFSPKKSLRGCLHQYANPALIAKESEAWQETVSEKYDVR